MAMSTFKALRRELASAETIEDFVIQAGRDILNESADLPDGHAGNSVPSHLKDVTVKIPRRNALPFFNTDEGWMIR